MDKKLIDAGFEERRFYTGELELNYVVGLDDRTALVLIPGQMGTWTTYRKNLVALAEHFQVFALDIRGHGKSDWATGDYCWASVGRDIAAFAEEVVGRPAIYAGNSSGGLISLWMAANHPEFVSALVLEDAPVFSTEMPRFKERDRYAYEGLAHFVDRLGDIEDRDLADYFRDQTLPVDQGRREKKMPGWAVDLLSILIRRFEKRHPGEPLDIPYFPGALGELFKSISQFDPDFARAFVDGRFYEGLDHAEALQKVRCPTLVMHANWFRHPDYGLVGAMDDDDARRIQELVPHAEYMKIPANHIIHRYEAAKFNQAIIDFARRETG